MKKADYVQDGIVAIWTAYKQEDGQAMETLMRTMLEAGSRTDSIGLKEAIDDLRSFGRFVSVVLDRIEKEIVQ